MEIIDTLQFLVKRGEELVPNGGGPFTGYNGKMQPEYGSWRLQAIDAISQLGKQAQPILKEIDSDKQGAFFYEGSASRILGALKAALAIAERQTKTSIGGQDTNQQSSKNAIVSNAVFIVHGHNEALLHQVARFIEQLDIKPIVLFEEAGKGQTIIEKLETNSNVGFTVVLLTPDDMGRNAKEEEKLHPRSRQNVIFELGFFIGKLGREKVAALFDESVELPSDYRGVEYIKIDDEGAWRLKLAKEMKAAGLIVDMNKAI